MTTAPVHGPQAPSTTTPARRPGSVRRTSSVDMTFPEGPERGVLVLEASARDLVTHEGDTAVVSGSAGLTAQVAYFERRRLVSLTTTPVDRGADLVGLTVSSGFRSAVDTAYPEERERLTPLYLLLDDLPVAALIAGYVYALDRVLPPGQAGAGMPKADLCSGWRSGGTMMSAVDIGAPIPLEVGPPAPVLELPGDDESWQPMRALPPGSMRRRRRLDVWRNDVVHIDAMFRDTFTGESGAESVVHEYTLRATTDPQTFEVLHIEADPRVLPWTECPFAADSAKRLIGTGVQDLRTRVKAEFTGISTCTHLNDLLRTLADVPALERQAAAAGQPPSSLP